MLHICGKVRLCRIDIFVPKYLGNIIDGNSVCHHGCPKRTAQIVESLICWQAGCNAAVSINLSHGHRSSQFRVRSLDTKENFMIHRTWPGVENVVL